MSPTSRIQQELKQSRPFPTKTQEASVGLLRTADVLRRLIDAVVAEHGITTQQYNVMRILRGAGERGLPTLEIAERMIEDAPGITRLIDRLEAKTLVSRERCTVDRRRVYCRITSEGLALLAALDEPVDAAGKQALGALGDQRITELISLLDSVRDGAEQTINAITNRR